MKAMIEPEFWNDPDFEDITDGDTLYIYLYLLSNSCANSLGAYRISIRTIAFETRKTTENIERCLKDLSKPLERPKVMFDRCTGWLWVRGSFSRNYKSLPNPNLVKNICSNIEALELSDFPYWSEFEEKHKDLIKTFQSYKGKGKGKGNSKDKSRREYSETFELFWKECPRKQDKGGACDAWIKNGCDDDAPMITNAMKSQAQTVFSGREMEFIPLPATWLNRERWNDTPTMEATKVKKSLSQEQLVAQALAEADNE